VGHFVPLADQGFADEEVCHSLSSSLRFSGWANQEGAEKPPSIMRVRPDSCPGVEAQEVATRLQRGRTAIGWFFSTLLERRGF
jgi:hypothetical protein